MEVPEECKCNREGSRSQSSDAETDTEQSVEHLPNLTAIIPAEEKCKLVNQNPNKIEDTINMKVFLSKLRDLFRKYEENPNYPAQHEEIITFLVTSSLTVEDVKRYNHVNPDCGYTRNLIEGVPGKYNLLLLCWNVNKVSPIHDHPCNGCFIKVISGSIRETRYHRSSETGNFSLTEETDFVEGQVSWITEKLGWHKVKTQQMPHCKITLI